jgi:mRNA interferase MazF
MPKTVWATFSQGKVELLEQIDIPDGSRVLVTILPDEEDEFWLQTSQVSLDVVNSKHTSQDLIITPLTSKISNLLEGEFVLSEWVVAGLNVATAVKRGLYTVHASLIVKLIGKLANADIEELEKSLCGWLGL